MPYAVRYSRHGARDIRIAMDEADRDRLVRKLTDGGCEVHETRPVVSPLVDLSARPDVIARVSEYVERAAEMRNQAQSTNDEVFREHLVKVAVAYEDLVASIKKEENERQAKSRVSTIASG